MENGDDGNVRAKALTPGQNTLTEGCFPGLSETDGPDGPEGEDGTEGAYRADEPDGANGADGPDGPNSNQSNRYTLYFKLYTLNFQL